MAKKDSIAVNTQHTGDPRKDNRGYVETMTSEQFDKLLQELWLKGMVAEIRGGKEKRKDNLPYTCPHYHQFRNNHRAQADIIPEEFTFMTCVDIDAKELVNDAIEVALTLNKDPLSVWYDMVLRMEYSARKKLHIYIRIPIGMTIEEAQRDFCQALGVPYDESCITPERFIYITGNEEEIYRSPHWLEPIPEEELAERREAYRSRGLDVDGRPLRGNEEVLVGQPEEESQPATAQDNGQCSIDNSLKPADARTLYIFDACIEEANLTPEMLIVKGHRHEALKSILSVGATQLLKKEELLAVLKVRMEKNWQDKNIQQLVDDFYSKYYDSSQKMSQFQRNVFAKSLAYIDISSSQKEAGANDGQSLMTDGVAIPPKMPKKLPSLIKLLVSKIPSIYKPAVAHAVFPALATHLCQVRFVYTDNMEHEATLMNCLMAGTGAGKSCIDKPIERIMADIMRRDEVNLRREAEWKNDCRKKSANKEKPPRPEGLVIQIIDPDMTNPALVLRMDEAEGHFVYVKLNELELFNQLKGTTGRQHFQLMCLAFDPGATYGQTRVGTDSVTARPQCRFNWNACTTIKMGRKYFRKVLTDGPISRINFCTIPEQEIGANQPKYGQYDAAFDEALKPYIDNLVGASGQINCPQAYKLIKKLQKECSDYASQSQSQTYWNLSHRACVIAWLKACVLYVANGLKWEREIDDFIRWSLNYDLWCKMRFFGAEIEQAEQGEDARIGSRGPKNMLSQLPDKFTIEDVKSIRQKQGMSEEGTSKMVSQWKSRGYILQLTVDSFSKNIKHRNSA